MNSPSNNNRYSIYAILLLTLIEIRTVNLIHFQHLGYLAHYTQTVVQFHAQWDYIQNRLLGPFAVLLLSKVMRTSFLAAYGMTSYLLIFAINFSTFSLAQKLTNNALKSIKITAYGALAFLLLQDPIWLYITDYFDILLFTFFAYAIFGRKKTLFFISLYLIAIFNRESALFIMLWLAIDAFGKKKVNVNKLILAIMLGLAGVVWTVYIRHVYPHNISTATGNVFTLPGNAISFWKSVTSPTESLEFLSFLAFPAIIWYLKNCWQAMSDLAYKVSLLIGVMLVSILLMGVVTETRVFFSIIPFLLFSPYVTKTVV